MTGTRRKIELHGSAGISALGEVWLMHNADVQCTSRGVGGPNGQRRIVCLNFCLTLKYEFYFIRIK